MSPFYSSHRISLATTETVILRKQFNRNLPVEIIIAALLLGIIAATATLHMRALDSAALYLLN